MYNLIDRRNVKFGIAGDPATSAMWDVAIPDDPGAFHFATAKFKLGCTNFAFN